MQNFKGEFRGAAYCIDLLGRRIRYGAPAEQEGQKPDLCEWQELMLVNGSLVTSLGNYQWKVTVLARSGSGFTGFLLIDNETAMAIRQKEENLRFKGRKRKSWRAA